MTRLLRSLIRETLLTEEVYGAQATVYHGTEADPQKLISALLNNEFRPGEGAGAMYGKGLYTVYDPEGAKTMTGGYGKSVIKLKVNLYGYIIFDPDTAQKVYGSALTPAEQAQKLGYDSITINALKGLKNYEYDKYTSDDALDVFKSLEGEVKGIVFTGRNDGRVVVVYDPTTVVPIAWKKIGEAWQKVDRTQKGFKSAIKKSATGEHEGGKYEKGFLRLLKSVSRLPVDKRIVQGDLDLYYENIKSLPQGLHVLGTLDLSKSSIASLPAGLKVDRYLDLSETSIESLPPDLQVGGSLYLVRSKITSIPASIQVGGHLNLDSSLITSLPAGLEVGGDISLQNTRITSLPENLQVYGSLDLRRSDITSLPVGLKVSREIYLKDTRIASLPNGLKVGGDLDLIGTLVTALPSNLEVGGWLHITDTKIKSLPADLKVDGRIIGFEGDISKVPQHLKGKVK